LKDCLGPYREDFTLAMLTDVLSGLADSQALDGIAVVTCDQRVAAIAAQQGLMVVDEHSPAGLNAAIDQGFETVRRMGAGRVVILPSDIPLLTGAELDRLLAAFETQAGKGCDRAIGISPSIDGSGTNCLIVGDRRGFTFQYGPDSFTNHRANARAHQQNVFSLHSPTISLDIDEPKHVDELLAFCTRHPEFQRTATWNFLHNTMGIEQQAEWA
jgi:2-phospho-L-lactate guanylyltransferase